MNIYQSIQESLTRGYLYTKKDFKENFKVEDFNIYNNIFNLNFLKSFINSNENEIIIHEHSQLGISAEELDLSMQVICFKNNIDWNTNKPFVSFEISINEKKYRLSFLHKCLGSKEHKYIFRKREIKSFPTEDFGELALILEQKFKNQKNILIAGETGSGKTSLLQSILENSIEKEHCLIIEDTAEIQLTSPNITFMRSQEPEKLKDFCSYAMRLSPRKIILGEMRSIETIAFILLLTSGHKSMASTIHASSAIDAIDRLTLLFKLYSDQQNISTQTVQELVAQNIEYIAYIENKKVKELIEVKSYRNGNLMYETISN